MFFKCHFFSTQLCPIWTRLYIITIINNCQSAASVQHSGCLISMAQHLFCGEADHFLQQARPITLVKWYHINQNLTRWQIWSYQIPRDTITNMSLSQMLSAGMPPPYQIYHPTGSQRVSRGNYHIQKSGSTSMKMWWVKFKQAGFGQWRGWSGWEESDAAVISFQAILGDITRRLSLAEPTSPLTLYMMMFIHHILTATSNQQQACKPSNLKYADGTRRHISTEHFSSAPTGFFHCLN